MNRLKIIALSTMLIAGCSDSQVGESNESQVVHRSRRSLPVKKAEPFPVIDTNSAPVKSPATLMLLSNIHVGMSFKEVTKFVPLTEKDLTWITHGGQQYIIYINDDCVIFRFENLFPRNPKGKTNLQECLLVKPPQLAFITPAPDKIATNPGTNRYPSLREVKTLQGEPAILKQND